MQEQDNQVGSDQATSIGTGTQSFIPPVLGYSKTKIAVFNERDGEEFRRDNHPDHVMEKLNKQNTCIICGTNVLTQCKRCLQVLCMGTSRYCFKNWHTHKTISKKEFQKTSSHSKDEKT